MVNELLTNAMKYAFVGRSGGVISISATKTGRTVSVTVADDGVGIPDGVDLEHPTGFGLMMVGVLAKQMNGTVGIERGNGTTFIVQFET